MNDAAPETAEQKKDGKKQKHRSPNYPYIGLEDALARTNELVRVAGISPIRITTAREVWSYKKGTGNQVVAALDAYKLVNVEGVAEDRMLKITTEARKILDSTSDSPELLKQSALAPTIHTEIWEHYQGVLPPDNRVLREYLVYTKGFNPAYVEKFIEQFRASLAFANVTESDKIAGKKETPAVTNGGQQMQPAQHQTPNFTPPPPPPPVQTPNFKSFGGGESDVLSFNLSRTSKAQVSFNGQITQEAIKKLIALLDLSVDTYPTQAELGEKDGKQFYAIAESSTGISEDELDLQEDKGKRS